MYHSIWYQPWIGCQSQVGVSIGCPVLNLNFAGLGAKACTRSSVGLDLNELVRNGECLGWGNWTMPTEIACTHPTLPEGTLLEYPCKCDFGKKCKVLCKKGYHLAGVNDLITCQTNGQWTKLPKCIPLMCEQPKIDRGSFEGGCVLKDGVECKVVCNSGYQLDGSPTVQCMNREIIGTLPRCIKLCSTEQLPQHLKIEDSCSGNVGAVCKVACTDQSLSVIGSAYVRCSSSGSGDWERPFPLCGCSPTALPHPFTFNGSCSFEVSKKCPIRCLDSYVTELTGVLAQCMDNGTWAKNVGCRKSCPPPNLPSNVQVSGETCSDIVCYLGCKKSDETYVTNSTLFCSEDGDWSVVPQCAKSGKCTDSLPGHMEFEGPCSHEIGVTCKVRCKYTGKSDQTTCSTKQLWQPLPACRKLCDLPDWPNSMQVPGAKCSTAVNDVCQWKCKPGYVPQGVFHIVCKSSGEWSEWKSCVKPCPGLDLPFRVQVDGPCSAVEGSTCNVKCSSEDYEPFQIAEVTCYQNGTWSDVPECVRVCQIGSLQLPNGLVIGNCTGLTKLYDGDVCSLSCLKDTLPTGDPILKCTDSGLSFPLDIKCLYPCRKPTLPSSLAAIPPGSCDNLQPNEQCEIQCTGGATLYGPDKVTCIGNNQFEPFPECRFECPLLTVHMGSYVEGSCSRLKGSTCTVKCTDKSKTIKGSTSATVTCDESLKWTDVDACETDCGRITHGQTVKLIGTCGTNAGSVCNFVCVPSQGVAKVLAPRDMTMKCQDNGQWTAAPICYYVCDRPHLPAHMLLESSCKRKINTWCEVTCNPPYKVSGGKNGNRILCAVDGRWGSFPSCV